MSGVEKLWPKDGKNVIHVGAHSAEEAKFYYRKQAYVLWIEANPSYLLIAQRKIDAYRRQLIGQAAIWDVDDMVMALTVSSNAGASSSLYDYKLQTEHYPQSKASYKIKVLTKTIDTFIRESKYVSKNHNVLVLDIQGAELNALRGAAETLKHIDYIICEVSYAELYENMPDSTKLYEHLANVGYSRIRSVKNSDVEEDVLFGKEK